MASQGGGGTETPKASQNEKNQAVIHLFNTGIIKFYTPTSSHRNFVNKTRILIKQVPIDRSRRELSIHTGFVEIRSVWRKLWDIKVYSQNHL